MRLQAHTEPVVRTGVVSQTQPTWAEFHELVARVVQLAKAERRPISATLIRDRTLYNGNGIDVHNTRSFVNDDRSFPVVLADYLRTHPDVEVFTDPVAPPGDDGWRLRVRPIGGVTDKEKLISRLDWLQSEAVAATIAAARLSRADQDRVARCPDRAAREATIHAIACEITSRPTRARPQGYIEAESLDGLFAPRDAETPALPSAPAIEAAAREGSLYRLGPYAGGARGVTHYTLTHRPPLPRSGGNLATAQRLGLAAEAVVEAPDRLRALWAETARQHILQPRAVETELQRCGCPCLSLPQAAADARDAAAAAAAASGAPPPARAKRRRADKLANRHVWSKEGQRIDFSKPFSREDGERLVLQRAAAALSGRPAAAAKAGGGGGSAPPPPGGKK